MTWGALLSSKFTPQQYKSGGGEAYSVYLFIFCLGHGSSPASALYLYAWLRPDLGKRGGGKLLRCGGVVVPLRGLIEVSLFLFFILIKILPCFNYETNTSVTYSSQFMLLWILGSFSLSLTFENFLPTWKVGWKTNSPILWEWLVTCICRLGLWYITTRTTTSETCFYLHIDHTLWRR